MTLTNLSPTPEAKARVLAAIDTLKAADPEYWQRCQDQRDPRSPDAAGSTLHLVPTYTGTLEDALRASSWTPYPHEAILPQCAAFRTFDLVGRIGLVGLSDLPATTTVELRDPKGTGKAEAIVRFPKSEAESRRPFVPYVVIILGPTDEGGECVWTFHPGPPIMPSTHPTPTEGSETMTAKEALDLGLKFAKIVVSD
jgi:hypothetical protein